MAAADITTNAKKFNMQTSIKVIGRVNKVTQADWIRLPYPGVANFRAWVATGADEGTLTHGTAAIDNAGTAYTDKTTQIVVGTAKITRAAPYYVETTSGEIMMVTNDSAPGAAGATLDVIRGCLGTTASATGLANTNVLQILNIIILGSAATGQVYYEFTPLPAEPKAELFAA